jgi:hypothetical protein
VRTGYSSYNSATPGRANCNAWSSTVGDGTTVRLPSDWIAGGELHVWDVGVSACASPAKIWCVED